MTPLDQLELDILAATGDIEIAEMAGLICYMFGVPPQFITGVQIAGLMGECG